MTIPPNVKYKNRFLKTYQDAMFILIEVDEEGREGVVEMSKKFDFMSLFAC